MTREDEIFLAKVNDAKVNAEFNNKMTLFKFLNLNEQKLVSNMIGKSANVYFSSGFNDGEYKRCIISPFEIEPNFKITILEVIYDKRYITLGHRNILGGLMSMGINRDIIGDIILTGGRYFVAVVEEMADYLINEAMKANVRFSLTRCQEEVLHASDEYDIKMYFLASLRLDVCVSEAYNLSRNESYEIITKGFVKVNHVLCLNPSKVMNINDVISVRTKGRLKIFAIKDTTRSNKIKVEIGRL